MDYRMIVTVAIGLIFIGLIAFSKRATKTQWRLKDIILVSILGAFFAAICHATALLARGPVALILTPIGLGGLEFEIVFGIFFFSSTFASYIIQKPGIATIVGLLTGFIQILLGSPAAATVWLSGLVQGFGAEIGFSLTGYKKWNLTVMLLAAFGSTVTSFLLAWQRGSWHELPFGIIALRFAIRLASGLIISGFGAKWLAERLAKAGVLKSYPLGAIANEFTGE